MQAILKTHDAHANRPMLQVRVSCLVNGVVIDVDDIVEHAHCRRYGPLQLFVIELAVAQMCEQIHRTEITYGNLGVRRIQGNFSAQIRAVHSADMLLGRTDIARILERDPRVPGLEQHGQHLAPQLDCRHFSDQLDFAASSLVFILDVGTLEILAVALVQIGHIGWRKQRPVTVLHHPLHEQIGHPVGRVHVMRAPAIVTGVFAQFQKFLDIEMPGFKVCAHRPLALATLVDRDGSVVDYFEKRDDSLGFSVGSLYVRTQRPDRRPVVAQPARILGQQRIFLDGFVDSVQIIRNGGEITTGKLRAHRPGIEQGRR